MTVPRLLLAQPFAGALTAALLDFIWQGALVAAALAAADLLLKTRRPSIRYAAACGALLLMLVLPGGTFVREVRARGTVQPAERTLAAEEASNRAAVGRGGPGSGFVRAVASLRLLSVRASFLRAWLLPFWACGVALLALRFGIGCVGARGLRRRARPARAAAAAAVLARLTLRLSIQRPVRLLESPAVSVPTVIGWLRPAVLLPVTLLTGFPGEQLEALVAHELAHVRRRDYLVNLLQCLAETLLFYHPAVWWVSSRIRIEREQCCDDLAVAAIGDARAYAGALVGLEELRGRLPRTALAASGGDRLWRRVVRLFPASGSPAESASRRAAALLALAAFLAAGAAARIASSSSPTVALEAADSRPVARRTARAAESVANARAVSVSADSTESTDAASGAAPSELQSPSPEIESALGEPETEASADRAALAERTDPGLAAAAEPDGSENDASGSGRLTHDELARLRTHGVTPEFVDAVAILGYERASINQVVALRVHGVTPEFLSRANSLFGRVSLATAVELRIHGVDPDEVRRVTEAGLGRLSPEQAVRLAIHGVTSDYLRALRDAGCAARSADEAVSLRIHGVTAEFLRALGELGLAGLSADEAVSLRIHGVTPELLRGFRALGYSDLSADDYTSLRIHGVAPADARQFNAKRGRRLSVEELIDLHIHGTGGER